MTSFGGLKDNMKMAQHLARKYLGKNVERFKESYDAKKSLTHYKSSYLVLYGTDSNQLDITTKLRVNFQGPYMILTILGDLDYRIQHDTMGKQRVVHHDKLKHFEGEPGLPWTKST